VTEIALILTTVPTVDAGERLARALVEERLAACVNVLPLMTSFYRWQGAVESAAECQLVVKTTRDRVAAVGDRIRELHTYELPELLVFDVTDGEPRYLEWLKRAVGPAG
jgi:periplasmic divalent cation tolerance protein